MRNEYDFSVATEAARHQARKALVAARERGGEVVSRGERYVRERPAILLASAFAAGFAVGALVVLATRPAPRRPVSSEARERVADLLGTIASNLRNPLRQAYFSFSDGASALSDSVSHALEKVSSARKKSSWR